VNPGRLVADQAGDEVTVARARKFAGTEEYYAAVVASVFKSFFDEHSCREGVVNLHAGLVSLDVRIPQALEPVVAALEAGVSRTRRPENPALDSFA
jgi:hypothetical protein